MIKNTKTIYTNRFSKYLPFPIAFPPFQIYGMGVPALPWNMVCLYCVHSQGNAAQKRGMRHFPGNAQIPEIRRNPREIAGFRRIFGLGLYPGIQDGAGPLPNGGGVPVMELCGVEIVILVGIQGDIRHFIVPDGDEVLPGGQPGLGVIIGDGFQSLSGGSQLLVHNPVAVVTTLHPHGIGGVVVPGRSSQGEAGGQIVHVVDLTAVVDTGQQGGEVGGGSLQIHTGLGHGLGQHGGQQLGHGVAAGVAPLDDQGLQLAVDVLVTGAGAGVGSAVGVQGPAVLLQQLLGLVNVLLIGVQVLVNPVLGLLVLPLGQAVVGLFTIQPSTAQRRTLHHREKRCRLLQS